MKNILNKKLRFSIRIRVITLMIIGLLVLLSVFAIVVIVARIRSDQARDHESNKNGSDRYIQYGIGNHIYQLIFNGIPYPVVHNEPNQEDEGNDPESPTDTEDTPSGISSEQKRLIDVGTPGSGVTATTDMSRFPGYDFGFVFSGFSALVNKNYKMPLNGSYTTLTFDVAFVRREETYGYSPLNLQLFDSDTGVMLWEGDCEPEKFITGVTVDITGVRTLEWVLCGGVSVSFKAFVGYVLNPLVW